VIASKAAGARVLRKSTQVLQPGAARRRSSVQRHIPDYSSDAKGLLLSGVIARSRRTGGLQKGDVIVEIGRSDDANIYDYTYALDVLSIGVPAKVIYTGTGNGKRTMLTPSARK